MTRTTAKRVVGAGAAVAAILALGACGGAGGGDGVASAGGESRDAQPAQTETTGPADPDTQALAYAACVREKGVDMPDPAPGQQGLIDAFQAVAGNYDRATLERALSACQGSLPQYAQEQHAGDDWQLALAECLREQGLDVSDTPFEDVHSGAIDQTEFAAAMEVCRDVLTGGGQ